MSTENDVYFKKSIPFKHRRKALQFRASQELFSSHQVDMGSRLLLRTLGDSNPEKVRKILDVGCGYGPLGLTLKKLDFMRTVHLVDRDALAIEYTRQNAKLNKLSNAVVYGSLGYDAVLENDFDLIVSNIPGKVGEQVITQLLGDAVHYLAPDGFVAVVVVTPLAELVEQYLRQINAEILLTEAGGEHVVFHYCFPAGKHVKMVQDTSAVDRGVYRRDVANVAMRNMKFRLETAVGLPEYDTMSYETGLMLKEVQRFTQMRTDRALVINPGQGYVPVAIWEEIVPQELVLAGRDLLSLSYAKLNLVANGCDEADILMLHQVGLEMDDKRPFSLIAHLLPKSESKDVSAWMLSQANALLKSKGQYWIGGTSTAVTRLESVVKTEKRLTIKGRKKHKGRSLLILEKR